MLQFILTQSVEILPFDETFSYSGSAGFIRALLHKTMITLQLMVSLQSMVTTIATLLHSQSKSTLNKAVWALRSGSFSPPLSHSSAGSILSHSSAGSIFCCMILAWWEQGVKSQTICFIDHISTEPHLPFDVIATNLGLNNNNNNMHLETLFIVQLYHSVHILLPRSLDSISIPH